MIQLTVNGDPFEVDDQPTLSALLDLLGQERRGVAVAVNEEVVPRSTWPTAVLRAGDRVEVLRAAQGG